MVTSLLHGNININGVVLRGLSMIRQGVSIDIEMFSQSCDQCLPWPIESEMLVLNGLCDKRTIVHDTDEVFEVGLQGDLTKLISLYHPEP
jgi:hypothetical protein